MSARPRALPTTHHAEQADYAASLLDLLARGIADRDELRALLELRRRALVAETVAIERVLGLRPAQSQRGRAGER
jgi:hypothetical protein